MKKILINAISIKMGGGLVVLIRLLEEMCALTLTPNSIHWIVIVDEEAMTSISSFTNVTLLTFPWIKKSPGHFFYWHEFVLPSLIFKMKIDFFFSQINTLPFKKLHCPTLLLVHNAGYFSDEFKQLVYQQGNRLLKRISWFIRRYWIYRSIKRATVVTVQTQALADAMIKKIHIPFYKIRVIPHGPGVAVGKAFPKQFPAVQCWRIGYITKFGIQKNFKTLFQALEVLRGKKENFQLVLTLDSTDPSYKSFEDLRDQYQFGQYIVNEGDIPHDKIRELYSSLDIFVYPSLCESFGFTLVEAMFYGLPVLAADTPSNREILGDFGGLFPSKNGYMLAEKLMQLKTYPEFYSTLSEHSLQQSQKFSWAIAAKDLLSVMNQLMVKA